MKKLGFLFVLIALGVGVLLPWAQLNFEGEEVASLTFPNFNIIGGGEQTFLLKQADNPMRIRFSANYKVGGLLPPLEVPIQVKLSDKDGTLVAAIISFPTKARDSGPEQATVRSGTNLNVKLQNDGLHKLQLVFAPNNNNRGIKNPDVESIKASFIADAGAVNDSYQLPALILGLVGFYLIVRSRKQRKENAPKKHRWGRGAS